ncbi:hypothetical protein ERS043862_02332, partial [Streptococcus pneumoniae]
MYLLRSTRLLMRMLTHWLMQIQTLRYLLRLTHSLTLTYLRWL